MTLIYDVGLHDGRDTARYLREGARVIAIDANPVMCQNATVQFDDYIKAGQLTILNRGIAAHKGSFEFWICDDISEWSSFNFAIASRNRVKHHSISVDCVPIDDVIREFGVPDYMKIDIEGNDRACLDKLGTKIALRYLSIEMDHSTGDDDLNCLGKLGYRKFKVICQNNSRHQTTIHNMWFYRVGQGHPFAEKVKHWRSRITYRFTGRAVGESGPWGEKTSGFWHSMNHAQSVWRSLRDLDQRFKSNGLGWWFDIHAKK
jgi:FkbM family methyltransferase